MGSFLQWLLLVCGAALITAVASILSYKIGFLEGYHAHANRAEEVGGYMRGLR